MSYISAGLHKSASITGQVYGLSVVGVLLFIGLSVQAAQPAPGPPWPTPADTVDYVYAVASSDNRDKAVREVKRQLAARLGIRLEQRAERSDGGGARAADAAEIWQEQVRHDFKLIKGPKTDREGRVWVMGRCARKDALEAALESEAFQVYLLLKKGDSVTVYPPLTDDNRTTVLGDRAGAALSTVLAKCSKGQYKVFDSAAPPEGTSSAKVLDGTLYIDAANGTVTIDLALSGALDGGKEWGGTIRVPATDSTLEMATTEGKPDPRTASYSVTTVAPASKRFKVELEVNETKFKSGALMTVRFRAERDGFAYLFNLLDDGSLSMLGPNPYRRQLVVQKGTWVKLPGEPERNQNIGFKVFPFEGAACSQEVLKLVVTEQPIEEFAAIPFGGFETIKGTDTRYGKLAEILRSLDRRKISWGEARVTYQICK